MDRKIRIRPYLDLEDVEILDRAKEVLNISYGTILTKILYESKTFIEIKKAVEEENLKNIKKAFFGTDN